MVQTLTLVVDEHGIQICNQSCKKLCGLRVEVCFNKDNLISVTCRINSDQCPEYCKILPCDVCTNMVCGCMKPYSGCLRSKVEQYVEDIHCCAAPVKNLCLWEEFCLGAGCYIALYQLLECGYFCELPFSVWLPVCSPDIFTCHVMQYMSMVFHGLCKFSCPMIAELASMAHMFTSKYRHAFVEGCCLDTTKIYEQTIAIVSGAYCWVQGACARVASNADNINTELEKLETKLQHRMDMALARMQREIHNTTIDLQLMINQKAQENLKLV